MTADDNAELVELSLTVTVALSGPLLGEEASTVVRNGVRAALLYRVATGLEGEVLHVHTGNGSDAEACTLATVLDVRPIPTRSS